MCQMDHLDEKILDVIQRGFPIDPQPYARIAETVGADEQEVYQRVMALLDCGVLRRLGASFNSRRLGFTSTLVALRLPEVEVARVAGMVNRYAQVTHNYQRGGQWNLWFTLISRSRQEIQQILSEIRQQAALDQADMMELPVQRMFKIDVQFRPSCSN